MVVSGILFCVMQPSTNVLRDFVYEFGPALNKDRGTVFPE